MKMYQLTCPSCNANIEIEAKRNSCFCSYCGNKIYLDDAVRRIEITKNVTYHTIHTDEAKIKNIEANERILRIKHNADIEHQKRKDNFKRIKALQPFVITLLIIICVFAYFFSCNNYFDAEKQSSNLQEEQLEEIVIEVLADIENKNFESARVKAETIYYTENWSDDIEKKWDATRKELLKQIDKAEKEWEKENKKSNTWWNPFD